jgi:hypothetical protein
MTNDKSSALSAISAFRASWAAARTRDELLAVEAVRLRLCEALATLAEAKERLAGALKAGSKRAKIEIDQLEAKVKVKVKSIKVEMDALEDIRLEKYQSLALSQESERAEEYEKALRQRSRARGKKPRAPKTRKAA